MNSKQHNVNPVAIGHHSNDLGKSVNKNHAWMFSVKQTFIYLLSNLENMRGYLVIPVIHGS